MARRRAALHVQRMKRAFGTLWLGLMRMRRLRAVRAIGSRMLEILAADVLVLRARGPRMLSAIVTLRTCCDRVLRRRDVLRMILANCDRPLDQPLDRFQV